MKQSGKRYAKMREIRDIAIRKINKINWRQLRLELILDARQDSTCDFFRSTPQRVKFHCVQLTDAWKESRSDDFEIFDKKLKLLFNFPERLLIMSKILNYTGAALSKQETQCQCLMETKEIRFSTDCADCLRAVLFLPLLLPPGRRLRSLILFWQLKKLYDRIS